MLKEILQNVKKTKPLVHNITNYVTVKDCANIVLACGGSPIMADEEEEVEEITTLCGGLNINIGTLNRRTISSMINAGKESNKLGHPVVLDPVGVGASSLRMETANKLIEQVYFSVIKGNISEIKTLAIGSGTSYGVDADIKDEVTDITMETTIKFAKEFAKKTNSIIVITGPIDIIANKDTAYCISNGTQLMSKITGAGCQLSALITAYVISNPDNMLLATVAAVCAMGIAGENAEKRLKNSEGNATFSNYIIDEIFKLTGTELDKLAQYGKY